MNALPFVAQAMMAQPAQSAQGSGKEQDGFARELRSISQAGEQHPLRPRSRNMSRSVNDDTAQGTAISHSAPVAEQSLRSGVSEDAPPPEETQSAEETEFAWPLITVPDNPSSIDEQIREVLADILPPGLTSTPGGLLTADGGSTGENQLQQGSSGSQAVLQLLETLLGNSQQILGNRSGLIDLSGMSEQPGNASQAPVPTETLTLTFSPSAEPGIPVTPVPGLAPTPASTVFPQYDQEVLLQSGEKPAATGNLQTPSVVPQAIIGQPGELTVLATAATPVPEVAQPAEAVTLSPALPLPLEGSEVTQISVMAPAHGSDEESLPGQQQDNAQQQSVPSRESGTAAEEQQVISSSTETPADESAFKGLLESSLRPETGVQVPPSARFASGFSVADDHVLQQILDRFGFNRRIESGSISLRLHPQELGELQLDVLVQRTTVQLQVTAQNPQVQELLERHMPRLREALAQQGFSLDRMEVTLADTAQGGLPQQDTHPRFQQHPGPPVFSQSWEATDEDALPSGLSLIPEETGSGLNIHV